MKRAKSTEEPMEEERAKGEEKTTDGERAIDKENPKLFTQGERKLRIPAPPNHGRSESRIEIINPESVQLSMG